MDGPAHEAIERKTAGVEPTKEQAPSRGATPTVSPLSGNGRMAPNALRLLALQRAAGNRATTAALRASRPGTAPVQRAPTAIDSGEQLAFAPKELPEETADLGPPPEKTTLGGGAAGTPAGSTPDESPDASNAGGDGGAGTEPGAGAPAAGPTGPPSGSGGEDPEGNAPAAGADNAAGAAKAAGAIKAAGSGKVPGAIKAAGASMAKPAKVAPLPPSRPLPAAATQAPTVKAAPAPQEPKRRPPTIDTTTQPTDFLRVVAPAPSLSPVAADAAPVSSGLPPIETLTVLRRPGGGAGGTGTATPPAPTSEDAPVWGTWTLDDLLSGGRTALELSRFIPMYGMLGGLAADGIGAYQDITAIPPGEYPITTKLVYLRSGLNIINNGVGHLMYVGTLIQDGLAGSVVGAEFVPVTATAMEGAAAVKVGFDAALFWTDLGVEIGALWNQSHSGPEQWGKWQGIVDGYQANLVGDVAGLVLDTITLSNAGAANVDTIKAGTGIFNTVSILAQKWGGTLTTFAQGMFNVWGSKLPGISGEQVPIGTRPPPSGPAGAAPTSGPPVQRLLEGAGPMAEAAAMRGAAGWLNMQAAQGRVAWQTVDAGMGMLQEEAAKKMAELNAIVMQLSGGKNLFQVIQEGAMSALGEMRSKLETLEQMQQSATDAEANGAEVKAWAEDILAKIDGLTVPSITVSPTDLGDGMLADAAEFLADEAGALAASVLNAAITEVREAVDEVKAELKPPIEGVRDTATEIGDFLALVARVSGEQTASIRGYIQNFEEGLGKCTGFEDAVDLIIRQVTELLGVPSFRVQDIRDFWQSLPGQFDQIDRLAARLVARAGVLEAQASVQRTPEMAAPAPDPEDEDVPATS